MRIKKVLITGSEGYIGQCLFKTLEKNFSLFGLDKKKGKFTSNHLFKLDLCNFNNLEKIIESNKPDLIIHLAGKSTIDDIKNRSEYERDNTLATKNLVKITKKLKIKNFIFSSTAAVYDKSNSFLKESSKKKSNNIYGQTKIQCENIIKNNFKNTSTKYVILRFFNVCSAIREYKVGELHNPETHLIPIAVNKLLNNKKLKVYGKNFNTKDGTCVRDYVHIKDICRGIEKTIFFLDIKKSSGTFNLGSGLGYSIIEVINKLKFKNNKIKYLLFNRRRGDVDSLVCSIKKAKKVLKWKPRFSNLDDIILDEIFWQKYIEKKSIKRKYIY